MKRLTERINIRNLVIVFLCITVIIMAIGYSILSIELKKDDPVFKVSFTEVEQTSSVKGGTTNPEAVFKIDKLGQRVDFSFVLNNPYDELIYEIKIKNEGNIPIEIKDIIEIPEYTKNSDLIAKLEPIKISYNDITEIILAPDEETELNLVVQYGQGSPGQRNFDYALVLIAGSPEE